MLDAPIPDCQAYKEYGICEKCDPFNGTKRVYLDTV
jgi:hypothetical protein